MKVSKCYCLSDYRKSAKKNIPKYIFDFIDGGTGNEKAIESNFASFSRPKLIPRIPDSSDALDIATNILDLSYAAPFGVAPLGLCGLINRDAELILAKAAAKFNVPYIASIASNIAIENIANAAGVAPWFQLYIPKVQSFIDCLIDKAEKVGCPVLVITVDVPAPGKRLRDLRNGLSLPFKFNISHLFGAVRYPKWALQQFLSGALSFPNYDDMLDPNQRLAFHEIMALQTGGELAWDTILKIRQKWKRKLVLKGVLSDADALRAKEIGVDAVIVSNHGGRQLNSAPAPIAVLPAFIKSGLKKEFLMLDSGIRSGEDVVVSLSQGAGFTFIGRPFLYALAAGHQDAVDHCFNMITNEIVTTMKLVGVNSPQKLSSKNVFVE